MLDENEKKLETLVTVIIDQNKIIENLNECIHLLTKRIEGIENFILDVKNYGAGIN